MELLKVPGIPLPDLAVCKDRADVKLAKQTGIPYVVWTGKHESLVKHLFLPTLEKMFPDVLWWKVLGIPANKCINVKVPGGKVLGTTTHEMHGIEVDDGWSDVAEDRREIQSAGYECECTVDLDDYVGDLGGHVNVEQLQALQLLPSFMDDIATNVRKNLFGNVWTEGYNKKLGVPIGNFDAGFEADNLIILDISHSIPLGIANTMITLIDTIRSQTNAHLIITSARSGYYAPGEELPDPKELRRLYGRSNESEMFYQILKDHVLGKHWGNVISFGDNDSPYMFRDTEQSFDNVVAGTQVDKVWHYHTVYRRRTGYADWVSRCCPECEEVFDTDWCSVILH